MPRRRGFEWITEDEAPARPEPAPAPVVAPRRSWPLRWLPALLLLAAAVLLLTREARDRYGAVAGQAEDDAVAAHVLLRDALRRGDRELLAALVSPADPGWSGPILRLATRGDLFAAPTLGLNPIGEPGPATVTMAATLDRAELRWAQAFETLAGETVTLRQAASYRLEEGNWRLAAPEATDSGEMRTVQRGRLALSHPAGDDGLGPRLAEDLAAALSDMCAQLADLDCPPDWRLSVRLVSHPAALVDLADPARRLSGEGPLTLPAPALVGLPAGDEIAYRALARGYAAVVVSRAVAELTGWACCRHGIFAEALLDASLARLGLRPWPLTPARYQQMFREPIPGIRYLIDQWRQGLPADETRRLQVYAVVEFMVRGPVEPGRDDVVSPVALLRRLVLTDDYYAWLSPTFDFGYFDQGLDEVFLRYMAGRSGLVTAPSPIPWPDQDVYALCGRSILRGLRLVRFRPETGAWQTLTDDEPFMFLAGAPVELGLAEGEGLLLAAWGGAGARTRLLAFDPGAETPWLDERGTFGVALRGEETLAGLFDALSGGAGNDREGPPPARLAEALGLPAGALESRGAVAILEDPNRLFVAANDTTRGQGLILATDPAGERVEERLRLPRPLAPLRPLVLSPDGRWLTARTAAPPPGAWEVALQEAATGRTLTFGSTYLYTYPGHDWSADGRWWLRMENGLIHLVAPDAGFERVIVHPFRMCAFGTWAR